MYFDGVPTQALRNTPKPLGSFRAPSICRLRGQTATQLFDCRWSQLAKLRNDRLTVAKLRIHSGKLSNPTPQRPAKLLPIQRIGDGIPKVLHLVWSLSSGLNLNRPACLLVPLNVPRFAPAHWERILTRLVLNMVQTDRAEVFRFPAMTALLAFRSRVPLGELEPIAMPQHYVTGL